MSAEDLTIQAGIALQQDLALVSLLGHRRTSSATATTTSTAWRRSPPAEQHRFPRLPTPTSTSAATARCGCGSRAGALAIGSLGGTGFASGAAPDWSSMRAMRTDRAMNPHAASPDGTDAGLMRRLAAAAVYYLPSLLVMLALLLALAVRRHLARCQGIHPADAVGGAARRSSIPTTSGTTNLLATLYAVLGAFVLSAVLGVLLAVVIVWNDLLLRTVMPVLILFNTLPKIALAPLFVVWLGYGIWPNIVIGTTIAFFPMVVNTAVGLASAEPEMLDLVRTLKAGRWQVLSKIRFPNALPYIFVGLKLAATMSVTERWSASSSPRNAASDR